jgi:hypothetical protein
MSSECSFQHIKSYFAAYPTPKGPAVHKTTQLHNFGCQNTLKTTSSMHNQNADRFLKNGVSLILSPLQHEYCKRVINV